MVSNATVPVNLPDDLMAIIKGLHRARGPLRLPSLLSTAWGMRSAEWPGIWGPISVYNSYTFNTKALAQEIFRIMESPLVSEQMPLLRAEQMLWKLTSETYRQKYADRLRSETLQNVTDEGLGQVLAQAGVSAADQDAVDHQRDSLTQWLVSFYAARKNFAVLDLWSRTRNLYAFDQTMAEILWQTKLEKVPVKVLSYLPDWSVCITAPGLKSVWGLPASCVWITMDSSWAHAGQLAREELEKHGEKLHGPYLHFTWLVDPNAEVLPYCTRDLSIYYSGAQNRFNPFARFDAFRIPAYAALDPVDFLKTIDTDRIGHCDHALLKHFTMSTGAMQMYRKAILQAMNLALYLCSEERDEVGDALARITPRKPKPGEHRPPLDLSLWNVGFRVGSMFRTAQQRTQDPHPRTGDGGNGEGGGGGWRQIPHVRRAHWHTYWTGKGRTEPKLNWLHPMLINTNTSEHIDVVAKEVADGSV